MRWTFSIALMLLLFTSCTSSKQLKKHIAPNVNKLLEREDSRLQGNITVQLDSSIVVPDVMVNTKTLKKSFVPLLVINMAKINIRSEISPEILVQRISLFLKRNAGLEQYSHILADKSLAIVVKSIPNSFAYFESFNSIATPFFLFTKTRHEAKQEGQIIQIEYRLSSSTDIALSGKMYLYMNSNRVSGVSAKKTINSFFLNWDVLLNKVSMDLLKQLLIDYHAKKK